MHNENGVIILDTGIFIILCKHPAKCVSSVYSVFLASLLILVASVLYKINPKST